MKPLENMTDVELIETVMKSELDYDFRIHAAKQIMKRVGVINDDNFSARGVDPETKTQSF
ncbi:hypothetical protein P4H27_26110 [Paenibacillus taichungensis]|uniref:hypothetical protein n=1 Tax=Paenibacillus taichungensis TaxID=484184 RepID=UPI002DBB0CB2|nr:hypothetical protein [Paenibacillus taichungensis]MEC0110449.1 hypothetical protein [Paenibacillus taichungensis]MEC0200126.1 hypothetical protein [Paenibacillus taichungensis]